MKKCVIAKEERLRQSQDATTIQNIKAHEVHEGKNLEYNPQGQKTFCPFYKNRGFTLIH